MTEREELVERVARAILHRRTKNDLNITIKGSYVLDFDKELARAAIAECEAATEVLVKIARAAVRLADKYEDEITKLEAHNAAMRAALVPFAHPDLAKVVEGNVQGQESPVFQKNGAILKIRDFTAAQHALSPDAGRKKP